MPKRMIDTELWNNEEIVENFTAEDRYFWLYLLTNPRNNICGVFKNSPTVMARDMGLHKDTIVNLLYRFENMHKLIYADKDTNEVLILNWYKFNWNKSPKLRVLIDNELSKIISKDISRLLNERIGKIFGEDTLYIPYPYPSIPITNTNTKPCLEVLNNNINTTQARARVREEVSIEQFEQEFDCVDWEKYPNGETYMQVRDTLISLINNGDIAMWEVSHDLICEILDSMYKGRERREITDMNAYIFTIIKRKRNKK